MQAFSLDITGMTCTGSARRMLRNSQGVSHADVNRSPGAAAVVVDPGRVTPAPIEVATIAGGYRAKARPAAQSAQVPS